MKFVDYYLILEVKREATQDEIKEAFRRLTKKHHPDVCVDKEKSTQQMQLINAANNVLKDSEKRKKHDSELVKGEKFKTTTTTQKSAAPKPKPEPTRSAPAQNRQHPTPPRPQQKETPPRAAPKTPPGYTPPKPQNRTVNIGELERQFIHAVESYFQELSVKHPEFATRLNSTLRWHMKQQKTAFHRGENIGRTAEESLRNWARTAKVAADAEVKPKQQTQHDTQPKQQYASPVPKVSAQKEEFARLREQVTSSVKFYYEELIAKHPIDKQALISTLHWQMTQQKTVVARGAHTGQTEEQLMWGWAYNAKRAADAKVEKR